MKIKTLEIKKFRHLKNINIHFGSRVTAIAGQNGTGKSSILGLVGHVFSFREKDNTIPHKTIDQKPFETVFSEIFQFSYPKYDKSGEHNYRVGFDDDEFVPVISSDRNQAGRRKLRLNVGKKEKGEGKRSKPVIYLGLRRLFPLAQEKRIHHLKVSDLTAEEVQEYQDLHNAILLLDEKIKPEFVDAFSKKFYATTTSAYDQMGNSAGQDNVGQIITAILSFKRLKKSLGASYPGGILLIDEIDATLYAAAQEKLIEKLFRISQDVDLQVIFTTHSIEIIRKIREDQYSRDSALVFLDNTSGDVRNAQGDALLLEKIINNLCVDFPIPKKNKKIVVFCEDLEASFWAKNILGKAVTKKLDFINENFGGSQLVTLANKKIPIFEKTIFILDGDQAIPPNSKCPRIIKLPGSERPEDIFFHFLKGLSPADSFWGGMGTYTKQVCFRDRPSISVNRVQMKDWFKNQQKYWGKGYAKIFNRWGKERVNKKMAEDFRIKFSDLISQIEKV